MKKLLCALAVAAVSAAGLFAIDLGKFPTGTWQDSKWNANWNFGVEGIKLMDSKTNEVLYTFNDSNMENFKVDGALSGVSISFKCADTHREYKFTKPVTLGTDLEMEIQPDWTSSVYKVKLPMQD